MTPDEWEDRHAERYQHGPVRVLVKGGRRVKKGGDIIPAPVPQERGWFGQRHDDGTASNIGEFKKGRKSK